MTARPAGLRRSLDDYVDQVKRKEQFLADHPDARIVLDREAPPYQRWHGHVAGCAEATSHELGQVLDQLDDLVVARDAHTRWPNWTFTRQLSSWQATQTDGSELVVGRTLEQVETRVTQYERPSGRSANLKPRVGEFKAD
jgi:hypothetical protein